jgi:integral membrane protein
MLQTSIGRLRAIGLAEAISFLILLGIAMPLKYFADLPRAVTIAGWLHGVLFMTFFVALMQTRETMKWGTRRVGMVLLAALLPFGPFVIDSSLKKEDEAVQGGKQKA